MISSEDQQKRAETIPGPSDHLSERESWNITHALFISIPSHTEFQRISWHNQQDHANDYLVRSFSHCYNAPSMMTQAIETIDIPGIKEVSDLGTGEDFEAAVIVFNCDCHTYQQVISLFCQIIPGMTPPHAFELAWQIDHRGSAIVFQGDIKSAETIGKKLAEGGLRVEVRY